MTTDQIAVIDLETTGLSPWRHDRVVEIGIVVISPEGIVETEYETLVNPTRDMGPSSIHHISAASVLKAPTFAEVAGDVLKLLAAASAVAGHNVSFDKSFLAKEYERLGVTIPDIPLLCTCRLFGAQQPAGLLPGVGNQPRWYATPGHNGRPCNRTHLAVLALADGIVTDSERRDLRLVAKLLGQDDSAVDTALQSAAAQLECSSRATTNAQTEDELRGQRVCFTGQLQSTVNGELITRGMAEALATQAGLTVASTVTKKLDILVVADPNTQSGKANKARKYGIRVLSDLVFWRMLGASVD